MYHIRAIHIYPMWGFWLQMSSESNPKAICCRHSVFRKTENDYWRRQNQNVLQQRKMIHNLAREFLLFGLSRQIRYQLNLDGCLIFLVPLPLLQVIFVRNMGLHLIWPLGYSSLNRERPFFKPYLLSSILIYAESLTCRTDKNTDSD